ncbi:MAG: peptidoglycan editing factor PgeF [Stenotrophobium sp.]
MASQTPGAGDTELALLRPDWPAPARVCAAVTTRAGGVSLGPYATLNLGTHVGDDPARMAQNRERLCRALGLAQEPFWLNQVHGTRVLRLPAESGAAEAGADAACATQAGIACVVLTADCLPVLFCDDAGSAVAVAHAGWRGLCAGVLENTVQAMALPPRNLMAWLGPAIGPRAFEVGTEVREAFMRRDAAAAACFLPGSMQNKYLADLYALARLRLAGVGVARVYGGGLCTYTDARRFYSYRREPVNGRMASLIWLRP